MDRIAPLAVRPGVGLDGYRWLFWHLPPGFPWHVDVMVDQTGMIVGWLRTKRINSITEAVATPETHEAGQQLNLLTDGQFLALQPNRFAAAETVSHYVKHTRA